MIWNEKYKIGVESIDRQHKELFTRTGDLLKQLRESGVNHKEECKSAILFLKQYAVQHFADEEAYQKSINYKDYPAHQKQHEAFVKNVLRHEKKMIESDFSEKYVKEFTGMLIAWLIYQVAHSDQKITGEIDQIESSDNQNDIVYSSVCNVLNRMTGFDKTSAKNKRVDSHNESFKDSIVLEVEFTGDITGYATFVYPVLYAKKLIYFMMRYIPEAINELELSSLFEITTLICQNICDLYKKNKGLSVGIKAPFMTKRTAVQPDERIAVDMGMGILEVDFSVDYAMAHV